MHCVYAAKLHVQTGSDSEISVQLISYTVVNPFLQQLVKTEASACWPCYGLFPIISGFYVYDTW